LRTADQIQGRLISASIGVQAAAGAFFSGDASFVHLRASIQSVAGELTVAERAESSERSGLSFRFL
jgi:hypothetical protein